MGFVCGEGCRGWPASVGVYMTRLSPPRQASDFSSSTHLTVQPIDHTLLHFLTKPAMASVSLDAVYHYQPAPSAGRPVKGRSAQSNRVASTQPFTRPVFKIPPKLPTPPPLSDEELAACEALRRRGWPNRFSPVSRSSHGYLPESGVLSTNHQDAEGSVSRFPSIRVRRSC